MSPFSPGRGGTGGDAGTGGGGSTGTGGGSGSAGGGSGSGSPSVTVPAPGGGSAAMLGSEMYEINRLTPDRTEYGPPIFMNPSDAVYVMPKRSNGQPVFVSTMGNSDAKFAGNRIQLSATDNPLEVSVRTLREIGVYSTVPGEGVIIVRRRRP